MIDGLVLDTYGMVSARLSLEDNLERVRFFEETVLGANTNIELVIRILFFYFIIQILNLRS